MPQLKDTKTRPPKILLLGSYGSGKTALVTTVGKHGLIIDTDDGLMTARTLKDSFFDQRQQIEVKFCGETSAKTATSFSKVKSYVNSVANECDNGTFKHKVVIVDSYTTLADASVRDVMNRHSMLGQSPQIQHWGAAFLQIEEILVVLRSLPVAVILTGHLRRVEDDGVSKYEIATPGQKLPEKIPTYFNEVWTLSIEGTGQNIKRILRTQPTGVLPGRTRSQIADKQLTSVGMPELFKQMNFEIGELK